MVVQLDPEKCKNPMLAACMMTVSEPKSWGAQGYIQSTGEGGKMGGQAYYRATWEEMELVGCAVALRPTRKRNGMKSKSSTTKTVEIAWLKRQMPKYVVPSIKDDPAYCNGYGDAVRELHDLLDKAANDSEP